MLLAFPDTSTFLFDESTRYYYDPVTGLLYEPNTRYFFDRSTQEYFFYDATRGIYIPASQVAGPTAVEQTVTGQVEANSLADATEPVKKKEKEKKEKTAKKIALEMERWAKRQNSQKEALTTVTRTELSTVRELLCSFSLALKGYDNITTFKH